MILLHWSLLLYCCFCSGLIDAHGQCNDQKPVEPRRDMQVILSPHLERFLLNDRNRNAGNLTVPSNPKAFLKSNWASWP